MTLEQAALDGMELDDQVVAAIRRIVRAVDLHSRKLQQLYGLTGPQLVTLREVTRSEPITPGELARAVHLSQPTITGILLRLERRGLIERSKGGSDRRRVMIQSTEAGRGVVRSAPSLLHDRFREQLVSLQVWEQRMILAMLERVAMMMDAQSIEAAPHLAASDEPSADPADSALIQGTADAAGAAAIST